MARWSAATRFALGLAGTVGVAHAGDPPDVAPDVVLDVRAEQPVTLWNRPAATSTDFRPVCVAPCVVRLTAGEYRLGLSVDAGSPVPAGKLTLANSATITASYQSRQLDRVAGFALTATSAILGPYLLATSFRKSVPCPAESKCADTTIDEARFVSAFGLIVVGLPVGIILLARRDRATVSLGPGVGGGLRPVWEGMSVKATF